MGALTTAAGELACLRKWLVAHDEAAATERKRLLGEIEKRDAILNQGKAGLDPERIALGRSVLKLYGSYARGGEDRAAVVRDAIDWLSTGKCAAYRGLDAADFGTKNYDRWHGQRSDHEWGGPRHGSIVFQVGLKDRMRALTDAEKEAAIYVLLNLEAIQRADAEAKVAA